MPMNTTTISGEPETVPTAPALNGVWYQTAGNLALTVVVVQEPLPIDDIPGLLRRLSSASQAVGYAESTEANQ